jgi:hypothetical protein
MGGWRKLQNEELHNLFFFHQILIERSNQGGCDGRGMEMINAYKILA